MAVHDCVCCGCGRQLKTIDFTFEDLGLKLRSNGHVVLQGVTGSIRHGRLTAVMGPSGYAHCVAVAVAVFGGGCGTLFPSSWFVVGSFLTLVVFDVSCLQIRQDDVPHRVG